MISRIKRLFTKTQVDTDITPTSAASSVDPIASINSSDIDDGNKEDVTDNEATENNVTSVRKECAEEGRLKEKTPEWVIPRFHVGSTKHTTKMKMRKAYPDTYRYTCIDKGWVCHYSSHAPTFAYAHAWLSVINKQYKPPKSWCLLHDLGQGQLYFIWVKSGAVQLARQCTQNGVDAIILHRAQRVYITNSALASLAGDAKTQLVDVLSAVNLKGFALKSTKHLHPCFALLLVALIAAGAYIFMPQKQVVIAPQVNPYSAYNKHLEEAVNASAAIENAVNLAAYGALTPDGWVFTNVSLQNKDVTLNIERQSHGLYAVINAWFDTHQALKPWHRLAPNAATVNIAMEQELRAWQGRTLAVNIVVMNIKDNALLQDWTLSNDNRALQGNVISHSLTLAKTDATLAELRSLAHLLAPLPVALTMLNLQSDIRVGVVNATLTIEFIGVI